MSEKFTASNGIRIWIKECSDGDYLRGDAYDNGPLHASSSPEALQALREFFQHERDQELGRWRWPEDPKWVVHKGLDYLVINEESGRAASYSEKRWDHIGTDPAHRAVIGAYLAAHPVPKPWHDAKPGEVWLMETEHTEYVMVAHMPLDDVRFRLNDRAGTIFDPKSPALTAGRRIWPEGS